MSTDQHAAAVVALLNAALAPKAAYDIDDIRKMSAPPSEYIEITLTRRFGGNTRVCGGIAPSSWRLTTRAVASTVGNARKLLDDTTTALELARITVASETSTPVQFETEDPIRTDDDNTWTGLRSWTYAF